MITWAAHLSMLFAEAPFGERPAAARAAGFRAVEIWWPDRCEIDPWVTAVREADLRVVSLNADAGDIAAGERGFLNVPDREAANVRAFGEAVSLAARVGAPRVNVLVGREYGGVSRREQLARASDMLGTLAPGAAAAGITILVEHLNAIDVPGYLLATPGEAADLVARVAHPAVRMLYDAYHAARAGGRPADEIATFLPLVDHVHYADAPGRGAPGTGAVRLAPFLDALEAAGYDGAVGLEYDPHGPTVPTLAFLTAFGGAASGAHA